MNNRYEVVVFDLGNVLIPFSYKGAIANINNIEPGLGDRFWQYYLDNYEYHRSFERGDVSEDDFINTMLTFLEGKVSRLDFCNWYSKVFTQNVDVIALLPELKKRYKLVLLSNTNAIHRQYGWGEFTFLKYFDKLILSHEVHAVKPEPEIYQAVEDFTQVEKAKHIFIDDVNDYVEGAKKAGWDGIQFISPEQLKNELAVKGII